MAAHVLLVEDSVLVTDALRILLEACGYRVSVAATSELARLACEGDRPDVMLLDLTLGREHGLDALAAIRERACVPPVVVAMTGHDDAATRQRCLDAGCREVLLKPVPPRELMRKLEEWTARVA